MSAVKLVKQAKRTLPTAEYMEITPELATKWLDDPGRNRKLNDRWIGRLAAIMKRGDWMPNNDAITFDEYGKLTNGQHRLTAVIRADVTVLMLVVHAVPGRAQLIMDQGRKRRPHEQVSLKQGWDVSPLHMAVAKAMVMGVGGIGDTQRKEIAVDIQQMDRFYVRHYRPIEWAVQQFIGHSIVRGVTVAPVMAPIARASYTEDTTKLGRFAEVVATGMADRPGESPAVVLRNFLIAGREKQLSSRSGRDRYTIYKKTEIALRAFFKGESIERLGQRNIEEELFPIPHDIVIKLPKAAKEGEGDE